MYKAIANSAYIATLTDLDIRVYQINANKEKVSNLMGFA